MRKFSSPAWMMAAFFAGIFFVYSCGGGGDYASIAIGAKGGLPALMDEFNALKQRVTELEAQLAGLGDLQAKLAAISDDGTTLTITGRNLQIVSGSGTTNDGGALTGLGNLIIGYNEDTTASVRTGSHNLIVGVDHDYTSYGGLVVGVNNTISGPQAIVSGGFNNTASGLHSKVSGGNGCTVVIQEGWAIGNITFNRDCI